MSTITGTTVTSGIVFGTTESSGVVTSPLTIASDGAVEPSSADITAILGDNTQAWTLVNQGTVIATGIGYGVHLQGTGSVTNETNALIQGFSGILTDGGGSRVVNSGTVVGSFKAVYFNVGGYLNNSGGLIQAARQTVHIRQAASTVINSGTIIGTDGDFGVGVNLGSGTDNSTVVNAGTISGASGVAVQFAGGGNRVVVYPGAVFSGIVNGGTGSGNLLELASAASTGTVSGIGTQYVGFSQVTVDSGAHWSFASSNTIGGGVTLSNFGTITATAASGNAVYGSSGTVVNGSTADTAALIAGAAGTAGAYDYVVGGPGGAGGIG
ncbi:MAG TPA: hypothetical protein VGQ90_07395, partial [Stellaceae bacterium]|nr:hypothetical protein [Stellaceae bacterium]